MFLNKNVKSVIGEVNNIIIYVFSLSKRRAALSRQCIVNDPTKNKLSIIDHRYRQRACMVILSKTNSDCYTMLGNKTTSKLYMSRYINLT